LRVAVAGAGIAGLATALALARRGIDVELFERARQLEEIGAGIQLSPNAMAVLRRLDLAADLVGHLVEPRSIDIHDGGSGARLTSIPLGETARARYGAPYCLVHRADLQAVLNAAARSNPHIALHLASEARDLRTSESGVVITAAGRRFLADGFVAADGVHSRFRTDFFGHPGPEPTGKMAWRASLPIDSVPPSIRTDATCLWLAPSAHLVHYPVRGGESLNVVLIANETESAAPPLERFGAAVLTLIASVAEWSPWPILAVDPARPWSRGRTVLVGDAAHAMLPSAAQGGAQALEDAWVLAAMVAAQPTQVARALAAFERARRPRVERIARQARHNLIIYNLAGFPAQIRNAALKYLPAQFHAKRLNWLYSWQPA